MAKFIGASILVGLSGVHAIERKPVVFATPDKYDAFDEKYRQGTAEEVDFQLLKLKEPEQEEGALSPVKSTNMAHLQTQVFEMRAEITTISEQMKLVLKALGADGSGVEVNSPTTSPILSAAKACHAASTERLEPPGAPPGSVSSEASGSGPPSSIRAICRCMSRAAASMVRRRRRECEERARGRRAASRGKRPVGGGPRSARREVRTAEVTPISCRWR